MHNVNDKGLLRNKPATVYNDEDLVTIVKTKNLIIRSDAFTCYCYCRKMSRLSGSTQCALNKTTRQDSRL